jgi:hypothetical protein
MQIATNRSRTRAAILMALLPAGLLLVAGWTCRLTEPRSTVVDLAPFKTMARAGSCADIRNRLFLIDDQWVFWDRAGNCADAAYGETLYGNTPDDVLCEFHDSIAGPMKNCQGEGYLVIFDTITANLDKPDLGLGSGHTVQPVPF